MQRGSSAAKRMVVFFSKAKCVQGGTYGAVKQETPLILLQSVYQAHVNQRLKRLFFVVSHYSSSNILPWAGLEDADSDYKHKETVTGNITKAGAESWGPFLNTTEAVQ